MFLLLIVQKWPNSPGAHDEWVIGAPCATRGPRQAVLRLRRAVLLEQHEEEGDHHDRHPSDDHGPRDVHHWQTRAQPRCQSRRTCPPSSSQCARAVLSLQTVSMSPLPRVPSRSVASPWHGRPTHPLARPRGALHGAAAPSDRATLAPGVALTPSRTGAQPGGHHGEGEQILRGVTRHTSRSRSAAAGVTPTGET